MLNDPDLYLAWNRIPDPTKKKVNGELWLPPKHRKERGLAGCLMRRAVITKEQLWQTRGPVPFPLCWQGAKQIVESSIKSFALPIPSRMVWSGAGFCDTIQAAKLLDQQTLKTTTLV